MDHGPRTTDGRRTKDQAPRTICYTDLKRVLRPSSRQPHPGHTQCVERFDAHRAAFDVDRVANARAAAQAAEDVSAHRRVRVFVDMQAELRVDIRNEHEAVDFARAVVAALDARRGSAELARAFADDPLHPR